MTTADKIKVMQAYEDGAEVEAAEWDDDWAPAPVPCWDWLTYTFRVRSPPTPTTKPPCRHRDECMYYRAEEGS